MDPWEDQEVTMGLFENCPIRGGEIEEKIEYPRGLSACNAQAGRMPVAGRRWLNDKL
jgi:hypothetical protein